METINLLNLPVEILCLIDYELDIVEMKNLVLTCTNLHTIAQAKLNAIKKQKEIARLVRLRKAIYTKPFYPVEELKRRKREEFIGAGYKEVKEGVKTIGYIRPVGGADNHWNGYLYLTGTLWQNPGNDYEEVTEKLLKKQDEIKKMYTERTLSSIREFTFLYNGVIGWDHGYKGDENPANYATSDMVENEVRLMYRLAMTIKLD